MHNYLDTSKPLTMTRYGSARLISYEGHNNANMAAILDHLAMYGESGVARLFWIRSTLTDEA